jgi:hypothetical protein
MSSAAWKANLIALLVAQTCVMIAFSFVFPFIPLYVRDLGVTDNATAARWAGAIGAAAAVTMAIAQPIWGSLADRYGRRVMVLRSIAVRRLPDDHAPQAWTCRATRFPDGPAGRPDGLEQSTPFFTPSTDSAKRIFSWMSGASSVRSRSCVTLARMSPSRRATCTRPRRTPRSIACWTL